MTAFLARTVSAAVGCILALTVMLVTGGGQVIDGCAEIGAAAALARADSKPGDAALLARLREDLVASRTESGRLLVALVETRRERDLLMEHLADLENLGGRLEQLETLVDGLGKRPRPGSKPGRTGAAGKGERP